MKYKIILSKNNIHLVHNRLNDTHFIESHNGYFSQQISKQYISLYFAIKRFLKIIEVQI